MSHQSPGLGPDSGFSAFNNLGFLICKSGLIILPGHCGDAMMYYI